MPLVQAKCTNCGANLEVDSTKDAAVCPFCGTPFVVEKAINNYNVTNNIQAGVVNVFGGNSADFVIRAGTLEKYTGAATDVVIPNSVTSIGANAFQGCTGLTSVTIPGSVTSIGESAFQGCTGLTSVTIPNSVTSIGDYAFSGCRGLIGSMIIPDGVPAIGKGTFCGCSGLTSVTIPESVKVIGGDRFSGSLSGAFEGCVGLSNVTIPNSVTSIGARAFAHCAGLKNLTISNNVKEIEGGGIHTPGTFEGCTGLTNLIIPSNVTYIGERAFFGCTSLQHVQIEGMPSVEELYRDSDWNYYERGTFGECPISKVDASVEWIERYGYKSIGYLKEAKEAEEKQRNSGGCYIATVVYGSYDCPQVWTLRRFRDNELAATWYGCAFIRCYYAVSPTLVKWFGKTHWFQVFWKKRLDKLVRCLNDKGTENTPYRDKQW